MTLATVLVAVLTTAGATASCKQSGRRSFSVGIYDDGMTLGNPAKGFALLNSLRAQVGTTTCGSAGRFSAACTS